MGQGHGCVRLCALHPGDARQFCFKVKNGALVEIILIEVTESALEQMKDFRYVMLDVGADFDQLDKIRRGLRAPMISSKSCECIDQRNLTQGMQIRFAAFRD